MSPHDPEPSQKEVTTRHVRRLWNGWISGGRTELETILSENPHFLDDHALLADLVYSEYWLRKQLDESVSEEEYLHRFPQIADILRGQFIVGKTLLEDQVADSPCDHSSSKALDPRPPMRADPTLIPDQKGESKTALAGETVVPNDAMVPNGFTPICVLGIGGMGIVVKAIQLSLNREVAIKSLRAREWIPDAMKDRLRKEADVVGKLRSAKVVQIYDIIEEHGRLFLVMEYVSGKSLAQAIASRPLEPKRAALYIRDITMAIQAAHEAGFLHRDVKPTNVLLSERDEIKVTDFGLARTTEESSFSISGELLGTPAYMAPEQIRGDRTAVDVRTDVYGIGATLYEALTGRPPFVANSAAEILHQVLYTEATPPQKLASNIPRDLQSICLQCLEKIPVKRYSSATALLEDIERFLSGKPTKAKPISRLEKSGRWIRRNPVQFFSSAGLVLCLVLSLVVATWYFARATNLEAEGALRNQALLEANSKERLSQYLLLISAIQNRIAELPSGWTWKNEADLQAALSLVPNGTEKQRLRNLAIQTLEGFDLQKSTTLSMSVDPYGLAWSPDGHRLVLGENVTRTLPNQDEAYVLYAFGRWPERPLKEILLPAIEPEKIAAGLVEGVRSLLFFPDNRRLWIGCRSGWIQVYDFELEKVTTQWKAHDDWCYCLVFDPSRHWLLSGSRDGSISIWDASTFQRIRSLKASGPVKCLQITENHLAALGTEFDLFSLVDFQKIDTSAMTANSDASIMHLSKTRDRFVFASPSRVLQQDLQFQNSRDYLLDRTPFTRSVWISHVDESADGNWMVLCGVENALFLNNQTRKQVKSIPIPGAGANYITFDPHGPTCWVANNYRLHRYDQHLPQLWKFASNRRQCPIADRQADMTSPCSGAIGDHRLWIQFAKNGQENHDLHRIEIVDIPSHSTRIEQVFIALDGGLTLSDDYLEQHRNCNLHLWNATQQVLQPTGVLWEYNDVINSSPACMSLDHKRLWICDNVNKVGRLRVVNLADGIALQEKLNSESAKKIRLGGYEDVAAGNKVTITLSSDHKLSVFNSRDCTLLRTIDLGLDTFPKVVAMHESEELAFVGVQDGRLLSVDLTTGQISILMQGSAEITALAHSRMGLLAIGYHSGDIELWSTKKEPAIRLCRLSKMDNAVHMLEYSRDGNQLAVLVKGEQVARLLDWTTLRNRLRQLNLDWDDDDLLPNSDSNR